MKIVLTTLNAKYIHTSLALRYLQAYCRPVHDIHIKEFSINNSLLDILSELYAEKPAVLGVACYIWNINMTLELVRLIKKVLPNIIIILGGPEVSYDPEPIMNQYPEVDYIVQGEGEETLGHLLSCIKKRIKPQETPNLVWRQGEEVIITAGSGIVADLNTIPFPYQDNDIPGLKDKIIYYESSRGCPFSCQYCLSSITKGVRFLALERVFSDIAFFVQHDVRQVKFVDRTFNAKKEYYLPILKFIAGKNCKTNFHFEIAADILDEEVLQLLSDIPTGRVQFEIGVQSTNPATLKHIQRTNHWPKIVDAVSRIVAYGNIHVHLDLIVGLPEEGSEQFEQSFNDVYQLRPHMLQIGFLKLLKGSGIRLSAQEHHYIFMDTAPYQVLGNQYLSYDEIRKLHQLEEVFNQIYNSSKFKYSLPFFIQLHGGNAFKFYQDLTDFWEEHKLHLISHSPKALFIHVFDFCKVQFPLYVFQVCEEFLRFDALTANGNLRPDALAWNEDKWNDETSRFWRNEELVHKYIPGFKFTTWRDIKKKYHIEVFSYDLLSYINTGGTAECKITPVLFIFEQESASFKEIDGADFWVGG